MKTIERLVASTCAKVWSSSYAAALLQTTKSQSLVLWRQSAILNHPFCQPKRGFVFIHVPKTAGTSLREALGLISPLNIPVHAPAKQVVPFIRRIYPEIVSVAFVRNPYARFVSLYNFARQDESLYHSVSKPGNAPYGKHANYDLLKEKTLEECAELLLAGRLYDHGGGLTPWHPQVEWLVDETGELGVDYIGRIETLQQDLQQLKELYQIDAGPLPWLNKSVARNAAPQFTERVRDLVRLYYKRDFYMLGYDETWSESDQPLGRESGLPPSGVRKQSARRSDILQGANIREVRSAKIQSVLGVKQH